MISHGALIAAFSLSAVCYSRLRRGVESFPDIQTSIAAFLCSFLFFLQLRVSDEFKDAEEDARYRPYRPVPRGLVTLRELGVVAGIAAAVQLFLAVSISPSLVLLLFACWIYMGLMSQEFFVRKWLKAHPSQYLWTHMLILPLIDLYVTACDWWKTGRIPSGLVWLLAVTFLNGIVIEIGRKLRAQDDEEFGVETYSRLWGRSRAIQIWLLAMGTTGFCAWRAAAIVSFDKVVLLLLICLLLIAVLVSIRFLERPVGGSGKRIGAMSAIWSLLMYLSIGLAPLTWKVLRR